MYRRLVSCPYSILRSDMALDVPRRHDTQTRHRSTGSSYFARSTNFDRTFGTNLGNDPLEAVRPCSAAGDIAWPHHRPSRAVTMVVGFGGKSPNGNSALGPGGFCELAPS